MSKSKFITIAFVAVGVAAGVWLTYGNSEKKYEQVAATTTGHVLEQESAEEGDVPPDDSIEASDGQYHSEESILVNWQSKLSLPTQLEKIEALRVDRSVPLIEKIDGLIAAAVAGDADAAWKVAESLGHCISARQSERQLRNLIDRTSQTRQVDGKAYPVDDVRPAIENFEIRHKFCKGIENDQALDHLIYLKLAAEHGNRQAQIDFDSSSPLPIEDIYEGISRVWGDAESKLKDHSQYLLKASEAGYFEAFEALGRIGESGYVDMSIVEAKAYQIAGHHLLGVATGDRSAREELLNLLINEVGPNDAEAAIRRANEIIQSENCCTYIGQRQRIGEQNEN